MTIVLPSDFGTKVDPDAFHIKVIGRLIESNEDTLRTEIVEKYMNKHRQVMNQTRSQGTEPKFDAAFFAELQEAAQRQAA
jgi:hypothetical protein